MNTILKADSTFDSSAHNLVYVKLYINKFHVFLLSLIGLQWSRIYSITKNRLF